MRRLIRATLPSDLRPGLAALLLVAQSLTCSCFAQSSSLTTTFTANNGQAGCMFDVRAVADLRIAGFDLNLDVGLHDVEIWTTPGGFQGKEQNPSAWTLAASVTGLVSRGEGVATRFTAPLCLSVARNNRLGIYITLRNGLGLNYITGTSSSAVVANNADLEIFAGTGNLYPFGPFFSPRNFSGVVYYELGALTQACTPLSPPQPPPFQVDVAPYSFRIDGQVSNGLTRARSLRCLGTTATVSIAAPLQTLHEMGVVPAALQSGGTLTPSGRQRINLDLSQPTLLFLYGGIVPTPVPLALPSLNLPVTPATPLLFGAQALFLDPTNPDLVQLSQAAELEVTASVQWPSGPSTDEEALVLSLQSPPICVGSLAAFGTSWTEITVTSNGRIGFGTIGPDFSPSVAEALAGAPFFGVWGDLDPGQGGLIALSSAMGGGLRVEYQAVPPFLGGGNPVSFALEASLGGVLRIDRGPAVSLESGLLPWRDPAFLGISGGAPAVATDPGPTLFLAGQSGAAVLVSDALYRFGEAGRLLAGTGLGAIEFRFDPQGRILWQGF